MVFCLHVVVFSWLLDFPAATCKVYLGDGSAETIVPAATEIEVVAQTTYLTQSQSVGGLLNVPAT